MKTLLFLLLVCISTIVYAQDTTTTPVEDKQVVGVIKIYLTESDQYLTDVTYIDTTELKYGGFTLYDIVIRSYLNTFPLLYPDLTLEALRNNLILFKEEYEKYYGE